MKLSHYYKDTAYMIPYGFYQRGLYVRKDWFEEKGLELPTTWEELLESGEALTDESANRYGYSFRGGSSGYQYADTIYWSWIGMDKIADPNAAYFLKDGDGATIFTLPEAKEALNFYKELYQKASPSDSIAWAFSEMVQGFVGRNYRYADSGPRSYCNLHKRYGRWILGTDPIP